MSVALGSFHVRAERSEAEAFAAATGVTMEDARLPLTFPMRWLVRPEIRAALMTLVPETGMIPVHESQTFDYERPLHCDETYVLTLTARRAAAPERLFVEGFIAELGGARCGNVETILRLFPMAAAS